jgi:putative nucleotidyltransferase with HDIG domain
MLIADADVKAWDEFREALGESWSVVGAASSSDAIAEAQKQPFDVVVANYDLPEPGGAELLNQLRVSHPKTLRFIAANAALKEKIMCSVTGCHQFLTVPFDRPMLKTTIERALEADYGMSDSVRELVGRIRTFPTLPSIYLEVVNALKDPNATTADVGAIIAKDMAMTTKLIQVLNSAYFGLPRSITDPTEAVGILGFETVKSLIISLKLLSQYDKVKPVYFSIDNIWRHSINVARTARVMALLETNDTHCSSTAYTAGLMHDLGKVIIAANFDDEYKRAHAAARKQQMPLWAAEKAIFGATHGEIGAYLLALWGLSPEVVKVAALHHHAFRSDDKTFTPLTAVHVANALEYEGIPDTDGLPAPVIDLAYLQQLGMADRVELWRFARRNPDSTKPEPKVKRTKDPAKPVDRAVVAPPVAAPKAVTAAPAKTPPKPFNVRRMWKWLGIGFGAAATMALVAWLGFRRSGSMAESLPAANPKIAEVVAPKQIAEMTRLTPDQPANVATRLADQRPPAPAPTAVPATTALDRLQLQAVFFSSKNPSALISGQLAHVNQQVADCRVLEISPSSVTLGYQNQRRTLTLR